MFDSMKTRGERNEGKKVSRHMNGSLAYTVRKRHRLRATDEGKKHKI